MPLLTFDKLMKFALQKYTDQSHINNHVWGSSSKRDAEFVALAAEVTTLKDNLNIAENKAKEQKPNGGGGGAAPKDGKYETRESKKEKAAHLALQQSECTTMKKVPPMPGGK